MRQLTIQTITADSGEKRSGYINIPGTQVMLPVTVVCGHKEGKTVLITGGIHNAEYVGIQAAIEVAELLDPDQIEGNIIIVNLVNRTGFEHRTMSVVYEDGKNLNREFPGNPEGTLGEQICSFMEKEFFSKSDFYIDLHCGDGYEELTPYVYSQGKASEIVRGLSKKMASAVEVPYLVLSSSDRGGAYNYAGALGIPGILLERGCMGAWSREEVRRDIEDVKNILRVMQVLKDGEEAKVFHHKDITEVTYEDSAYTGCWYPCFKAGDIVSKGDVLGIIKDYFGKELDKCIAKHNGVILYQTASLCILENGPMIAYGQL